MSDAVHSIEKALERVAVQEPTEDPRKTGLKNGLRQLSTNGLRRVIGYTEKMCLDTFNYNEEDKTFCPLAIGIGLDGMAFPYNEKVEKELLNRGYEIYNTRGIKGDFYTTRRLRDLLIAASEVLIEKLIAD